MEYVYQFCSPSTTHCFRLGPPVGVVSEGLSNVCKLPSNYHGYDMGSLSLCVSMYGGVGCGSSVSLLPAAVTPPLKNVRRRRFKKMTTKKV